MDYLWIINRLRAMSPAEIVHRSIEKTKKITAKGKFEGWDRYRSSSHAEPLPGLKDRLRSGSLELHEAVKDASRSILSGTFVTLGVKWPPRQPADLFPTGIWRLDPVTGKLWPGADTYCFDIPYRHEKQLGDVKYVWEFNRLQFLQPLAADVALTGNPKALTAIETAIESWAKANPPFRGVQWAEILNVAMRAISLLIVSSFCVGHLSPETDKRISMMLRAHAFWLERFPSAFSSANNHLIAEVAAEYLIAVALDRKAPSHAQEKAWRILCNEVEKQFLPDGMNAEQSPTYGAFSAEFALLAIVVAEATGRIVPEGMRSRLTRFADYVFCLADGQGRVPSIGDNDEGRVLTLCRYEERYPASVATAIAGVTGADIAGVFHPYPTLRDILGTKQPPASSPTSGNRTFSDGGLSVIRDTIAQRSVIMTFDHGPLGYLSIAAHGHADALSISLSLDEQPVLVDPGTYLYHSGGTWRNWFRGTRAHNTLNIDGIDQSTISGSFNWSHKANATLTARDNGPPWALSGRHDGYLKRFGAMHERTVERQSETVLITDRLTGRNVEKDVEIAFQFATDLTVEINDRQAIVARGEEQLLSIGFSHSGVVDVRRGGDIGDGGWVSEKFGEKLPACRLTWRGKMPSEGVRTSMNIIQSKQKAAPGRKEDDR
ncbi:MAG TPA: alginate lyase family protein [Pararhizobium sp.]|uniref:heparinase II/III family protein n=1 Tax=Pararhizobium sp. TaxID=1977563 RepID=UPI002C0A8C1A|nr:alginate lyase family protein [Pararhizobium sp.]HTO29944.1 alginate lyase family protein [Pararhizobium sp.]